MRRLQSGRESAEGPEWCIVARTTPRNVDSWRALEIGNESTGEEGADKLESPKVALAKMTASCQESVEKSGMRQSVRGE